MTRYTVRAADSRGTVKRLVRESSSEQTLARELAAEGLTPVHIAAEGSGDAGAPGSGKYSRRIVEEFTETMSLLLNAGLTVRDALRVAADVFSDTRAESLVRGIVRELERGHAFSDTLDGFRESFPPLYRGLVRIGERVGSLDRVFSRLARYLGAQRRARDRTSQALTYPSVVVLVAVGGVAVISLVAVPRLAQVFQTLGPGIEAQLTASIALFYWIVGGGAATMLLCLGGAAAAAVLRRRSSSAAVAIDGFFLRLPVLGRIVTTAAMLNFAFAMETLVDSGLPVRNALADARGVTSNHAIAAALQRAEEAVARGTPLSVALGTAAEVPRRVASWVGIGENTGDVAAVFGQLRAYYEGEQERVLARFMALVEPALIILVGIVILLIVVLFVLPIFGALGSML